MSSKSDFLRGVVNNSWLSLCGSGTSCESLFSLLAVMKAHYLRCHSSSEILSVSSLMLCWISTGGLSALKGVSSHLIWSTVFGAMPLRQCDTLNKRNIVHVQLEAAEHVNLVAVT